MTMRVLLIVLKLFSPGAEVYAPHIDAAAKRYGFDPYLVAAVIYKESRFKNRRCYKGSYGLMQIQLRKGRNRSCRSTQVSATRQRLYDPRINIMRGVRLMYLWRKWTRSIDAPWHWLLNYNQGFGRCKKKGCKRRERVPIQTGRIGGYARRVLKTYNKLLQLKAANFPNG